MNGRDVVLEQALVLEDLTAVVALVLLEVCPQVLPHRLVRSVFAVTDLALDSVVPAMIEHVQSQLVLAVEIPALEVAREGLRLVDRPHVLLEVGWRRQLLAADAALVIWHLFCGDLKI
jgi:hypothetical protein